MKKIKDNMLSKILAYIMVVSFYTLAILVMATIMTICFSSVFSLINGFNIKGLIFFVSSLSIVCFAVKSI